MASELEELLLAHPGLSSVGVVVRFHALAGAENPAVSIVAQRYKGAKVVTGELRGIVARVVPGIKPENVSIQLADERDVRIQSEDRGGLVPFLMFWKVPKSEYGGLALLLMGLLVIVSALASLGGYIYGQFVFSKSMDLRAPRSTARQGGATVRDARDEEDA